MKKCSGKTEVFSRVTGFYSVVQRWNKGKKSEFEQRRTFKTFKGEPIDTGNATDCVHRSDRSDDSHWGIDLFREDAK